MIIGSDLSLRLGDKQVFDHLSFVFAATDHVGLIGRNGMGKTTLLRVIAGQQQADDGSITVERGKTIAYLPQDVALQSTKTIFDEAMSTFQSLVRLNASITTIEVLIDQKQCSPEQLEQYAHLCAERVALEPEKLAVRTKLILQGLGFGEETWQRPVPQLSAGWRMRLVLAKLLLQDADFYLFDEPTNHLDIVSKDWFLSFLQTSGKGFILVSHDRFILDHACSTILELERGKGTLYRGNYSFYEKQKVEVRLMQQRAYDQQQREIKHKEALVDRFRAKASKASMAQSLIKKLEKITMLEPPEAPLPSINLHFKPGAQPGRIVLSVRDVKKSFGEKKLFEHVSFEVERYQRVALVAANGVGKSTLLSIINGSLSADGGKISFGHNVKMAMFEQEQDTVLDKKKTVLEEALSACQNSEARQQVRTFLGAFLFSGDDVEKSISVLSGGEKNRVAMTKLLLANANFLMLDEPTNHLDIDSQKMLLDALLQFPGTLLFVSHERSFLNALATHVVELTPNGTTTYRGNYDSYLEQKAYRESQGLQQSAVQQPAVVVSVAAALPTGKALYEMRKKIGSLEKKIEKLEAELARLQDSYAIMPYNENTYREQGKKIAHIKTELDETFKQWEELVERMG